MPEYLSHTPISSDPSDIAKELDKHISHMLTPSDIVKELDKHIIGQEEAKRALAVALRNRWRRKQLPKQLRDEIVPKNILMIGPTGVGKTAMAKRLAKLADAPFIKVEATKFTEVGYVGRDVESIIRDLTELAIKMMREKEVIKVRAQSEEAAEERILNVLLPQPRASFVGEPHDPEKPNSGTRELFRKRLRDGEFDHTDIEIDVQMAPIGVEIMSPPGMEEMTSQLQSMFQSLGSERKKSRTMKVAEAKRILQEEEAVKLIDNEAIKIKAIETVEESGIVFIDEIDKIAKRSEYAGADVSREGVQRDLLPLIEGSTVSTKYGMVRTDHILFIASGAFHFAKPSDLIPELQGRLPIRVELKSLSTDDFVRILTEPQAALTVQYAALLGTEGVIIHFASDGVRRIAEIARHVNERIENIGARRLHTVLEKLLEEVSYQASDTPAKKVHIDADYVNQRLQALVKDEALTSYIL